MAQSIRTRTRWLRSAKRWPALAQIGQRNHAREHRADLRLCERVGRGHRRHRRDKIPRYGEIQSFYSGLKSLQCDIDIVPPDRDLSGYKVVVASNLRLIDDRTVDRLKAFVAGGGTLVLNYRAATQNIDNSMRLTLAPGPFAEIAGSDPRQFSIWLNTTRRMGISMAISRPAWESILQKRDDLQPAERN